MRKRIAKKIKAKNEAMALIPELLEKAKKSYKEGNNRLYRVYSNKINYLYMKHKIRLPKEIKRQICKHCYGVLLPSLNARIRTKEGKLIIYCMGCKKYTRILLK